MLALQPRRRTKSCAKIRSFAEEEIKPLAFLMDQNNEFPRRLSRSWVSWAGWAFLPQ